MPYHLEGRLLEFCDCRVLRAGPIRLNSFPRAISGFLPGSLQNAVFSATEEGRSPTGGVPDMGTGLEVKVLRGACW